MDVLKKAGVECVGAWLSPAYTDLTYLENLKRTAGRQRQVAQLLDDFGPRLGLENVGTRRSWTASRHSFIHTVVETKRVIAGIGVPNVGFVLDSRHWWTSYETGDDIEILSVRDVVSADPYDAPGDFGRDEQYDNQCEPPLATGVIQVGEFLGALVRIGSDGRRCAEPFNKKPHETEDHEASRISSDGLLRAFALVEQPFPCARFPGEPVIIRAS